MIANLNGVRRAERRLALARSQNQPTAVIAQAEDAVHAEKAIAWLPVHEAGHSPHWPHEIQDCPHCNPAEGLTVALTRLVLAHVETVR